MSTKIDPRILSQVAHLDGQVHRHRSALAAGRKREADLEQLRNEYAAEAKTKQKRLDELETANKALEAEIEEINRQAKKHNGRLSEIQDSREYRALNEEVRYLRRQVENKEETMLANMELIEKAKAEYGSAHEDFEAKSKAVADEIEQIRTERGERETAMADAAKALDHYLDQTGDPLARWWRRRAARMPLPVVWATKDACGFCHHKLTPQKALEVKQGRNQVTCDTCARIVVAAVDENTTVSQ